MPANGTRDLIWLLKVNAVFDSIHVCNFDCWDLLKLFHHFSIHYSNGRRGEWKWIV